LLTHVGEITFPIQKRVEFGRLGELDPVDPVGALGVFIDELRLAGQRFVYAKDFAAYGRIEVACRLDRLDNADRVVFLHLRAEARELNEGHRAEPFLSIVRYADGSDTVLDDDVFVILAVSNLHDFGSLLVLYGQGAALPSASSAYKSTTMSPWGCEQISTLPSTGALIWNVPQGMPRDGGLNGATALGERRPAA
jgi:hypothetical protein